MLLFERQKSDRTSIERRKLFFQATVEVDVASINNLSRVDNVVVVDDVVKR